MRRDGVAGFAVVEIGLGDGDCAWVNHAAGTLGDGFAWYGRRGFGVWVGGVFELASLWRKTAVSEASIAFSSLLDG